LLPDILTFTPWFYHGNQGYYKILIKQKKQPPIAR